MFFTFLYKYDLDAFVGSFLIVLVSCSFLGVFFRSQGSLGVILGCFLGPRGPSGLHFGSKSELWEVGGSLLDGWWFQGGLQGEKISFSPPILGSFGSHFSVKNHDKITTEIWLIF